MAYTKERLNRNTLQLGELNQELSVLKSIEFSQHFEYFLTEINIRQSEFMFIKSIFKDFNLELSLTSVDSDKYY